MKTKAIILAAGLGARLLPLTEFYPKPLVKVNGMSLIEHWLTHLQKIGVTSILINVHHHAKTIMAYLGDGARYGVNITYQLERQLLKPGGTVKEALSWLKESDCFVISADIYTHFDCTQLLPSSDDQNHAVLGVIQSNQGPWYFDEKTQRLSAQEQGYQVDFSGIAWMRPRHIFDIPKKCFGLGEVLNPLIQQQKVSAHLISGMYYNVGTWSKLLDVRRNKGI